MANKGRISRTIGGFNGYITNTDTYLQTLNTATPPVANWQRLGLTQANADQWHAYRQAWENGLYPQYLNVNTKTKTVNEEVEEAMDIFRAFAQPLLDIMDSSPNATLQDANALNFKIGRSQPTHPTTPIADSCYALIKVMGGGKVRIACRTQQDAKRASMAKDANIIQVAAKIGGTAPVNYKDGTTIYTLGKADSIQDLGVEAMGQTVWAYFRWANTRYPHLSSQYSPLVSFIVS